MRRSCLAKVHTLHDVARSAGVSLITASRALSNPAEVSKATIERVQQAVEATGYIPNLLAGGLKSRRSMTVAALVPVISVPQFLPTVQALTEDAGRRRLPAHPRPERATTTRAKKRCSTP